MYRVFAGSEAGQYPRDFEGILRLRHRVFNERMNWAVSSSQGMERDRFDDLDPIYFASVNDHGFVDGTWRLLPTTGPYMLSDVFPFLLDGRPVPRSPLVWEMSRLALERDNEIMMRAAPGEPAACTMAVLFAAAMEWCMFKGVLELVVVHDARMARITKRLLGYPATWETRPFDIDGVRTTAAQYRIDSPMAFRMRTGIAEPVLNLEGDLQETGAA